MVAAAASREVASEATPLAGGRRRGCVCGSTQRVAVVTCISSLAEGFDIGVINGAMILFREDLHLTDWELGVVLAVFPVGVALFSPMAGSLLDVIGRKSTLMLSNVILVIGGLAMAFASSFQAMAFGRIVAGAGVGIGIAAGASYMSEVAPPRDRGFYGALEEISVNGGQLCGFAVNMLLLGIPQDWRYMMGAGIVPAGLAVVPLALPATWSGIAESPRYLQKAGKTEKARAVLKELLRGDEKEVDSAVRAWEQEAGAGLATWGEALEAFCGPQRRAAVAGIGTCVLNVGMGIAMLNVMTTSLLVETGMPRAAAMQVTMALGIVKAAVMSAVALFALDSVGRRPLLPASLCICCAASALGAVGSLLPRASAWQVGGFCLFVAGFSIGVGPVPWVYMPEVLENRLRGKGCGLGFAIARCCVTVQLMTLPVLLPLAGLAGFFAMLLALNLGGFAFVLCFCPETKGRRLEEMHVLFA